MTKEMEIKISATVLGRIKASYARLESALREQNIDSDTIAQRVASRKSDDALTHGVTVDELESALDTIRAKSSEGKLDGRKAHIANLQHSAHVALSYDNALLASKLNEVEYSRENFDAMLGFLQSAQSAKREVVKLMRDTEYTSGSDQGYCFMVHSPLVDLVTGNSLTRDRFYLMCGGWNDKSRAYDQYGVRQVPSGEATFYREISFSNPKRESIRFRKPKPKAKHEEKREAPTPAPEAPAPEASAES